MRVVVLISHIHTRIHIFAQTRTNHEEDELAEPSQLGLDNNHLLLAARGNLRHEAHLPRKELHYANSMQNLAAHANSFINERHVHLSKVACDNRT